MNIRVIEAAGGWDWYVQAYGVFRRQPWVWIGMVLLFMGISAALNFVPLLGGFIGTVLNPIWSAGIGVACEKSFEGKPVQLELLFEGFKRNTKQLLVLGAIGLALVWVIILAMAVVFVAASPLSMLEVLQLMQKGSSPEPEFFLQFLIPMLLAMWFGLLAALPYLMAMWFAPYLVMFRDQGPWSAMKLSFFACGRNWLALTVFGLVAIPFWFLALLPLGLGLFIAIPVFMIASFAGYREIFESAPTSPESKAIEAL